MRDRLCRGVAGIVACLILASARPSAAQNAVLPLNEDFVRSLMAQRCPRQATVVMKLGERTYAERLNDFDLPFREALKAGEDAQTPAILEAYRRCIDVALEAIRVSDQRIIRNPEDDDCIACSVRLSDLAFQVPRLLMLRGLTYLYPASLEGQDASRAVADMRNAVEATGRLQTDFQARAEQAFRNKRKLVQEKQIAALREARNRETGAAIVSLAGVGLGLAMGLGATQAVGIATDALRRETADIEAQLNAQRRRLNVETLTVNANFSRVASGSGSGGWTDDGVRVSLPRFGGALAVRKGDALRVTPLGALGARFSSNAIVRVVMNLNDEQEGLCTGTVVGPRLIVTNRHCVVAPGETGLIDPSRLEVRYEDVEPNAVGLSEETKKLHPVKITAPKPGEGGVVASGGDWAFIETRERADGHGSNIIADPQKLEALGDFRVALAGYAHDLNSGSVLTLDWGCLARWREPGVLVHHCKSWNGASGSPVISVDGSFSRAAIVGVHSGRAPESGDKFAQASAGLYETWVKLRDAQSGG